mgnify:CR=1 FL=1
MTNKYILGLDLGTSSCKSIIIDNGGKVIASASATYPVHMPRLNWVEQDPLDWWNAAVSSMTSVLQKSQIDAALLLGIGLSGQMHGLVALDDKGNVLRPAILWNDQRSFDECEIITEVVGGKTRLHEMINNDMLPGYTASKIVWLARNEPDIYRKARMFLNPKDYIRYKLTDGFATDVSDASGTGLFDVERRCWNDELLDILGLSKAHLPACFESVAITGFVTAQASDCIGLPKGLPVVAGGGDAVAQTTGTGLVKEGMLGTIIGTAGIVAMGLGNYRFNERGSLQIFCNNYPNVWHAMGVTLSAGASLEWLRNILYRSDGNNAYKKIDENAALSPAGSRGLVFLPYLFGERCPYADPKARGAFIGLINQHDIPDLTRAVMEGVVFSLKQVSEMVTACSNIPVSEIRTSGGGAQSQIWKQIQADVFQLPVKTMSAGEHGGAFGAALIAGVGCGIWADIYDAVGVLETESETMPNRNNKVVYEELYMNYKNMYPLLHSTFNKLSNLA